MFNKSSLFSALVLTASFVHARPGPTWVRRQENAQSSLTLDPAVVSQGLAQDGQGNTPDPGQVRSETSTNNFINHCLKFLDQGVPLTDGKQITGGSCNQTPMGRIISLDKAPRSKFVFPKNGDESIVENTAFTVQMRMVNMVAGNFVNAQANYYAAPQQVDGNGILIGHSHIVIEPLPSLDSTEPLDPLAFKFFKGLNDPADGQGILKTEVTAGLPKGVYRMCSINTAANHQPALVSNAQHGALDDCSYFTIRGRGEQGNTASSPTGGASASAPGNAASSSAVAGSSTVTGSATSSGTAAPESTQGNQNGQNGQQGNNNGGQGNNTGAPTETSSSTSAPAPGQSQGNGSGQENNTGAPTETPGSTSAPAPEQSQGNGNNNGNNNGAPTETPNSTNETPGSSSAQAPEQSQGNGNGNGNGNNNGAPTETPGSSSAPAPEPSQGNNEQQGNSPGAPTEAPSSTPAPAPAPEPSQSNPGQPGVQNPEQGNNGQQSGNPVQPGQANTSPAPEQPGQGPNGQTQPEQNQGQQPSQGQADPTSAPGQNGQGPQRRRSHHGRQ